MRKTYKCELCGCEVATSSIPRIIAREKLCVDCYKTKYRALGSALKKVG